MSYLMIKPEFYQMLQPDSPWHAGSPGWSQAPVPGWGVNPNRVGPPRWGVGQDDYGERPDAARRVLAEGEPECGLIPGQPDPEWTRLTERYGCPLHSMGYWFWPQAPSSQWVAVLFNSLPAVANKQIGKAGVSVVPGHVAVPPHIVAKTPPVKPMLPTGTPLPKDLQPTNIRTYLVAGLAIAALAGLTYLVVREKRKGKYIIARGFFNNPSRRRRYRSNGCRDRGQYLFPDEKKYPVPTKACARTALAYASWPNNIEEAGDVIRALKREHPNYAQDPKIKKQMKNLAEKYHRQTGEPKPRV